MPRVPAHLRERALGMLQGGMRTADVARAINCHVRTETRLRQRYRETGRTADHPRSGRPRVTTPAQDRYIRISHLRDRYGLSETVLDQMGERPDSSGPWSATSSPAESEMGRECMSVSDAGHDSSPIGELEKALQSTLSTTPREPGTPAKVEPAASPMVHESRINLSELKVMIDELMQEIKKDIKKSEKARGKANEKLRQVLGKFEEHIQETTFKLSTLADQLEDVKETFTTWIETAENLAASAEEKATIVNSECKKLRDRLAALEDGAEGIIPESKVYLRIEKVQTQCKFAAELISKIIGEDFKADSEIAAAYRPIQDLKYSYIKKSLMGSVSDSGTVVLWDANTQKSLHSFENAHKAPACGLCFSPANELLFVTVGLDKKIICYDSSSKILLRSLVAESPLTAIDFMPDGAALAVGSSRGKVYLYDLRMLTSPVKVVTAHKTSVQCVKFQNALSHIKSSSKAPVSKSSSSLSAATSRRAAVKTGNPVANNLMSSVGRDVQQKPAAILEQNSGPVTVEKVDGRPDGRGIPNSTSLDVFPSKETDSIKGTDGLPILDKFDSVGRNSLSDVFSPIRDDYSFQKSSADLAKGDVMDFMSHFSGNLTSHKIPTSGLQTSNTLLSFGESPPKAEDADKTHSDSLKVGQATVGSHDTQNLIKVNRALSESANSSGCGNTSTPVMSSIKTLEPNERLGKDLQTKLLYDSPVSGAPCGGTEPMLSAALTEGVVSSLSEKIAGTINNNGSGPPLTSIQIHFIRKMIQETLEDFRLGFSVWNFSTDKPIYIISS
ncbi:NEDD1 protein, partial [Polypterus senegalus]